MTKPRTAAATVAASRARSMAALERKLREAATLLHLHGWYLAGPDKATEVRRATLDSYEWAVGDDVR